MSKPTGLTYLQAMNPFGHNHFARDAFGLALGVGAFYLAGSKKYVAPLNLSKVLTAGAIAFGGLEVYKNFSEATNLFAQKSDKEQKRKDAKVRYTAGLTYLVVIGLGVRVLSKPELASKACIPERFHIPFGKEILYAAGTGLAGVLALSLLGRALLPAPTLKETPQELGEMNKEEINSVVRQLNENKTKLASSDQLSAILNNKNRTEPVRAMPVLALAQVKGCSKDVINLAIQQIPPEQMKKITAKEFEVIKSLLLEEDKPLQLTQEQWNNLVQNEKINKSNAIWIINQQVAGKLENCSKLYLVYLMVEFVHASDIKHLSENAAQEVAKQPGTFHLSAQEVIELLKHKGISSENPVDISKHEKVFDEGALKMLSEKDANALAKAYGTSKDDQKLVMTQKQHTALGNNEKLSKGVLSDWREKESGDSDD